MRLHRLRLLIAVVVTFMLMVPSVTLAQDEFVYSGPFWETWARSDAAVALTWENRTWMWGPGPYSRLLAEPYAESPDGERQVKYFEKSRMEINDPDGDRSSPWFVTNGLLAKELITGQMQIGADLFESRDPASVHVAGDAHPDSPTYAMLQPLLDSGALPEGSLLMQRLNSDGSVNTDSSLATYGASAAYYVPDTEHTVAGPFWAFMNASGTIHREGITPAEGPLFPNPFFATGFPITEAYWVHVPVVGEWQDVLIQCFERRCLTYTPNNDAGWQVEAGNIGQHYYEWRYGAPVSDPPPVYLPPGIGTPPPLQDPGCVDINNAPLEELTRIVHIDEVRAQQLIERRPFMYVDALFRVPGISDQRLNDIREQGLACV